MEINNRVKVKEGSLGFLHPNKQADYTTRNTYEGEPNGTIRKIEGINSFVELDALPGDWVCFQSVFLELI
jgi:hypothetical protein